MNSGLILKNVCKNSLNGESAIESHLQPQIAYENPKRSQETEHHGLTNLGG